MANIRPKDLPAVTAPDPGDKLLLDGASARSILVTDFVTATTPGSYTAGTGLTLTGTAFSVTSAVNTQTADYTLALSDAFGTVRLNKASAINCTVPPNSSVAFPVGTIIEVGQVGAGQGAIVAGAGVTINAPYGLKFSAQHQFGRLRQTATDTWNWEFYGPVSGAVPVQSVTASGATTIDLSKGDAVKLSLTANSTISVSNALPSGMLNRVTLEISNTGAFNITAWPTGTTWAGGTAPTITSGSGKIDVIVLVSFDGGSSWRGAVVGQNFS